MITRKHICPVCQGAGKVIDARSESLRPCVLCKGVGHTTIQVEKKKRKPKKAPKKYVGWPKICAAITDYQKEYLQTMDIMKLRPMGLKHIAKAVDAHMTNVCIRIKGKTINNIVVKELFSTEVDGLSNKVVKHLLKKVCEEHPYFSDLDIQRHLESKGISISRRTVSKYRHNLGIGMRTLRNKK
jgi:hypothetical protein